MKKRRFALVLAIIMILSIWGQSVTVSAKTLSELNKDIKNKQSELKAQKTKSDNLQKEISSMEKKIKSTENDIKELDTAIGNAEDDLVVLEADLEEAKENVDQQNENLGSRLRNMYKNGTVGFIDVLLQSGDFTEFLTNLSMVQKVFESDEEVLKNLEETHQTIETKTEEVKELKVELTTSMKLAEQTKKTLSADKKELDNKKAALSSDIAQTQKELDEMEAEAQALTAQIRAEGSSSDTSTYNGVMCWPAPSYTRISCYFGWRKHPITGKKNYHGGTDLAAPGGSPILAADSGTVIIAAYHYSYGNYVVIDHGGGICTLYAHSRKLLVKKGQTVTKGEKIALVGTTGSSTGNHLHFEVRKNGVRVDGLPYIR